MNKTIFEELIKHHKLLQYDSTCISIFNNINMFTKINYGGSSIILFFDDYIIRMIRKDDDVVINTKILDGQHIKLTKKNIIAKSLFYNIYIEDNIIPTKLTQTDFNTIVDFLIYLVGINKIILDMNYQNFLKHKDNNIYIVDYPSIITLQKTYKIDEVIFFLYTITNLRLKCTDENRSIGITLSTQNFNSIIRYLNDSYGFNIYETFLEIMLVLDKSKLINSLNDIKFDQQ